MAESKYTRCLKCKRPLKNEIAQKRGYGSSCWRKHKEEQEAQKSVLFKVKEGK